VTSQKLFHPRGTLLSSPWELELDAAKAQWSWASLRILELRENGTQEFETGGDELLVLPLSGSCVVRCDGEEISLVGRDDVFSGPSDFAYLSRGSSVTVRSRFGGRFALPGARTEKVLPFRYGSVDRVGVEMRGAGPCSRQVNNFCTPETFDADRLISCEVLTPGGNWSSYPPHKHDEDGPNECALEEIYYYEVAPGPNGDGMAYQRVYGNPDRPIDLFAEVRSGDAVLIPHGWHGPSMAVPGYDLYYLNVMAGAGERAWRICDDPAHAWIRATWVDQKVDDRLPFRSNRKHNNS